MKRLRRSLSAFAIGSIVMATGTAFGIRIGLAIAETTPVGGTQGLVMAALADAGPRSMKDRYALAIDDGVLTVAEERDLYDMLDEQLGTAEDSKRDIRMRQPLSDDPFTMI